MHNDTPHSSNRILIALLFAISLVLAVCIFLLWNRTESVNSSSAPIGDNPVVNADEFRQLKSDISSLATKTEDLAGTITDTEKTVDTLQQQATQATPPVQSSTPLPTINRSTPVPGPAGPAGNAGPKGDQGDTGATGAPGTVAANCAGASCVSLQSGADPTTVESGSISVSGNILAQGAVRSATLGLSGATAFPSSADAGTVVYRDDLKQLFVYDGSRWQQVSSGIAKIVAPQNSSYAQSADYVTDGTDDQVEVQAAINSLPGAGVVLLADGTYTISSPIMLRSDLTLSGMGTSTRVKAADGSSINLIESQGQDMIYHLNLMDFVLDGNAANTSGDNGNALVAALDHADIARMRFENVRKTALRICPVAKAPTILCYLNVIRENEFTNVGEYGIWWDYPFTDSLIKDNNIGSTIANIRGQGGTSRIVNNHLDGAPEYNILFPDGGQSHMIIGNIIEHSAKGGIVYSMPPWEGNDVYQKIHIIGNLIRGCGLEADLTKSCIQIKGVNTSTLARGFNITGNTFEAKDVERPKSYISLENTDQVTITGNEFSSNSSNVITDIERIGTNSRLRILGNTSNDADILTATGASGTEVAKLDANGNLHVTTAQVNGTLTLGGALAYNLTHVAATHTIQPNDHFIAVDASGAAVTVNLPSAADKPGRELIIKASGTNAGIMINATAGQTIDGSTSLSLANPYASVTLVSADGQWHIIASSQL